MTGSVGDRGRPHLAPRAGPTRPQTAIEVHRRFSPSGIALGALVVVSGHRALHAMAPAHLESQEPLLDAGTTSYDAATS